MSKNPKINIENLKSHKKGSLYLSISLYLYLCLSLCLSLSLSLCTRFFENWRFTKCVKS